mmetsp:Transcript_7618/g.20408  ORF Transcript_7618/g.20408 Transcript_7618/m.20408 type:complete len:223 (+) Transcript_7618:344-1012(+)
MPAPMISVALTAAGHSWPPVLLLAVLIRITAPSRASHSAASPGRSDACVKLASCTSPVPTANMVMRESEKAPATERKGAGTSFDLRAKMNWKACDKPASTANGYPSHACSLSELDPPKPIIAAPAMAHAIPAKCALCSASPRNRRPSRAAATVLMLPNAATSPMGAPSCRAIRVSSEHRAPHAPLANTHLAMYHRGMDILPSFLAITSCTTIMRPTTATETT